MTGVGHGPVYKCDRGSQLENVDQCSILKLFMIDRPRIDHDPGVNLTASAGESRLAIWFCVQICIEVLKQGGVGINIGASFVVAHNQLQDQGKSYASSAF